MKDLFAALDSFAQRIPPADMQRWIENCPLTLADVIPYCRYHPEHYVRNLMHAGPAYHALVLCWRNGQRSPIHDHRGSGCAVKVLGGEAVETKFDVAPNGMVVAVSSETLGEGTTCYSEDADIHQISNLQEKSRDLITLHLYSPPLLQMEAYSLSGSSSRRFFDPINDVFAAGAGI